MSLLVEIRIPMPMTLDQYQVGQLYMVAQETLAHINGDTGARIIKNEPFNDGEISGQYTHKVFYLGSYVPSMVAALMPASMKKLDEKSWNTFPSCRTEYFNDFFGNRFELKIDSMHYDNDSGTKENVFGLSPEDLKRRKVVTIDIAAPFTGDKQPGRDPRTFKSQKGIAEPLTDGWMLRQQPIMCCYKLARIKFSVMFLQGSVENQMYNFTINKLTLANRVIFCMIDEWHGMNMDDIRKLEEEVKVKADEAMDALKMDASSDANSTKSNPI